MAGRNYSNFSFSKTLYSCMPTKGNKVFNKPCVFGAVLQSPPLKDNFFYIGLSQNTFNKKNS